MIATGNHNFERFAALCNTLPGEARALRASGSPARRPLQWLCKTMCAYHSSQYTPSASRSFGSSPRGGAKAASPQREAKSLPYGCSGNREPTATNALHPLSQICRFRSAVKSGSSLRGGAKAALPQREAKSLPYGCGINWKGIPFSRPLRCVSFGAVL